MSWRAGGVRPWVVQRLSALYMAVFLFFFLLVLMFGGPLDYVTWVGIMQNPIMVIAMGVFWTSLLAHAWVGGRDVILDYIHPTGLRFSLLALFGFFLAAMLVWVFKVLLVV